ncbi:MAG: ketopantoate reductase family protein [Pseudomonadota bacterium]|nr:ketopantoate reductase family protein [Pseudomonadota bacterium]
MRICILGAGALGSLIGGYLAQAGQQVTLIGRKAHFDAINNSGLRISGNRGEFLIRNNLTAVTDAAQAEGRFDYLILLVKAKDTATALAGAEDLAERIDVAITLQNGLHNEAVLADWCGADKVIGGVTVEGAEKEGEGVIRNSATAETTAYFGEMDGSAVTPRIQAIVDAFNASGLVTRAVRNIDQVEWEKAAQIGTFSAWCVSNLLGVREYKLADGLTIRPAVENFVAIAKEITRVYTTMGYEPQNFFAPLSWNKQIHEQSAEQLVDYFLGVGGQMKERGFESRTSMHIDALNGRKTEIDYILKPYLDKADALGIPVPAARFAYRVVKTVDQHAR